MLIRLTTVAAFRVGARSARAERTFELMPGTKDNYDDEVVDRVNFGRRARTGDPSAVTAGVKVGSCTLL